MYKGMIVCFCLLMAIPVGKNLLVTLEARNNLGMINIRSSASDFEQNSYFSGAELKGYTNSTLLLAGVCYRFGGSRGMPCSPNDSEFQYIKK